MGQNRVIVVGGGIIGLSIAEHLSRKGTKCVLLDRGPLAREASWAGAGYLDLRNAAQVDPGFFELCRRSYGLFPEWIERIKEESGVDPEYVRSGSLEIVSTIEEEGYFREQIRSFEQRGLEVRALSSQEVQILEPALSTQIKGAFYFEGTAQVRPPRLAQALIHVLRKRGIDLRENEPVEDFLRKGAKVLGVKTSRTTLEADRVVLASGAWASGLAEKLGFDLSVKPIRGQVVLFKTNPGLLKKILFSGLPGSQVYLVPRKDGHLYVGSTLESVGFDKNTTSEALDWLQQEACRLLPLLSQVPTEKAWAGLRPGSLDGWPYLGPVTGYENLWLATGHFTHGILLSAVTGELLSQALNGEKPSIDLRGLGMDRKPLPAVGL